SQVSISSSWPSWSTGVGSLMSYFLVLPSDQRDPYVRAMMPPARTITAPSTVNQGRSDTSISPATSVVAVVPVLSEIFCAAALSGLKIILMVVVPIANAPRMATQPIIQRPTFRAMDSAAPAAIVTSDIAVITGDASCPDSSTLVMCVASNPVAVTQVCVEPINASVPPSNNTSTVMLRLRPLDG